MVYPKYTKLCVICGVTAVEVRNVRAPAICSGCKGKEGAAQRYLGNKGHLSAGERAKLKDTVRSSKLAGLTKEQKEAWLAEQRRAGSTL